MVFDASATTETFKPNSRNASQMAAVISHRNLVSATPVAVALLDETLDAAPVLETQVAGTMGEQLYTEFTAVRPS